MRSKVRGNRNPQQETKRGKTDINSPNRLNKPASICTLMKKRVIIITVALLINTLGTVTDNLLPTQCLDQNISGSRLAVCRYNKLKLRSPTLWNVLQVKTAGPREADTI